MIMDYKPNRIKMETKLLPFVPEMTAVIGDIDAFVKSNVDRLAKAVTFLERKTEDGAKRNNDFDKKKRQRERNKEHRTQQYRQKERLIRKTRKDINKQR